eukprot:Skav205496  [mRNA]  locus=scaffold231:25461:26075:- [translate_table: standard]
MCIQRFSYVLNVFIRDALAPRMPLWKLMGSEEEIAAKAPPPPTTLTTQLGLEVQTLTQLGLVEEAAEDVYSLRQSMGAGARKNSKRIQLMHPAVDTADALPMKVAALTSTNPKFQTETSMDQ